MLPLHRPFLYAQAQPPTATGARTVFGRGRRVFRRWRLFLDVRGHGGGNAGGMGYCGIWGFGDLGMRRLPRRGKRRIPGYGRYPARPGVRVLAGRLGLRRRNGRGSMTLPCPAGKGALSVCGSDAVCPVGAKALRGNTPDPGGLTGRRDLWGTICPSGTAAGAPGYGRPETVPNFV